MNNYQAVTDFPTDGGPYSDHTYAAVSLTCGNLATRSRAVTTLRGAADATAQLGRGRRDPSVQVASASCGYSASSCTLPHCGAVRPPCFVREVVPGSRNLAVDSALIHRSGGLEG